MNNQQIALYGAALHFTASDVAKQVFDNYKLMSTVVSAQELTNLQIEAVANGILAIATEFDLDSQNEFLTKHYDTMDFINSITTV